MKGNRFKTRAVGAAALIALTAIAAIPSCGDQADKGKKPLLLFGFEGESAIRAWKGVDCEAISAPSPDGKPAWEGIHCSQTTAHVSEGRSAMSFTFPEYHTSKVAYPGILVDFSNGTGFGITDWSKYGKAAFDIWVDGDKECVVSFEIRSQPGKNGSSSYMIVKPGRKNRFEVQLDDLTGIDLKDIRELMIYTSRPQHDFRITIDNFQLIPPDKPPFVTFDLAYPNYRDMVFPEGKDVKVSAIVKPEEYGVKPDSLEMRLTASDGIRTVSSRSGIRSESANLSLPISSLKTGKIALSTSIIDKATRKVLASRKWLVSKISRSEASALSVYVDQKNNTIVGGKPFFPLGWYESGPLDHLAEIMDSPFNTVIVYGSNLKRKSYMTRYLDILNSKGKKLLYCMNDIYPTSTYMDGKNWEGITGNEKIAEAVVRTFKNHPALLAWYLNDERPKSLAPQMLKYYQMVRKADPAHPCYIVMCNMSELKYFSDSTDVMGVDPYPVPSSPLSMVADDADAGNSAVGNHKPLWLVPQGFAWYQFNSVNPDRGHIPSEDELQTGRAPTYEESRCMAYLALAHGAKGLVYFSYYNLRVLPNYDELWKGLKKIAGEVEILAPVLLSSECLGSAACSPDGTRIHSRIMKCDGQLYLIAVNAAETPCTVNMDLKRLLPKQADVMFEGRFARSIEGTKLTDSFKPYEVHVYDFGKTTNN